MEELRREALSQAIVWGPPFFVALSPLVLFLVHSRVAHFGVLRIVQRTRAHGPLGVNITGIVAGLGLTGFALGYALKDSISNLLSRRDDPALPAVRGPRSHRCRRARRARHARQPALHELEAETERVNVPNSKMLTDPIRVAKGRRPRKARRAEVTNL